MKRREPLNLAHVLEDRRPSAIPMPVPEKRIHTRFDKAFLVVIGSEQYGDSVAVARNVSAGGILVEMTYAPPLGTVVTVHFQHARDDEQLDEIVLRAEVKHHHYLNFTGGNDAASSRAIGLRFLECLDPDDRIPRERWH
ncbi:MAG TPA: PilZ domain-containing protein [Kofleriaceae bacterium]